MPPEFGNNNVPPRAPEKTGRFSRERKEKKRKRKGVSGRSGDWDPDELVEDEIFGPVKKKKGGIEPQGERDVDEEPFWESGDEEDSDVSGHELEHAGDAPDQETVRQRKDDASDKINEVAKNAMKDALKDDYAFPSATGILNRLNAQFFPEDFYDMGVYAILELKEKILNDPQWESGKKTEIDFDDERKIQETVQLLSEKDLDKLIFRQYVLNNVGVAIAQAKKSPEKYYQSRLREDLGLEKSRNVAAISAEITSTVLVSSRVSKIKHEFLRTREIKRKTKGRYVLESKQKKVLQDEIKEAVIKTIFTDEISLNVKITENDPEQKEKKEEGIEAKQGDAEKRNLLKEKIISLNRQCHELIGREELAMRKAVGIARENQDPAKKKHLERFLEEEIAQMNEMYAKVAELEQEFETAAGQDILQNINDKLEKRKEEIETFFAQFEQRLERIIEQFAGMETMIYANACNDLSSEKEKILEYIENSDASELAKRTIYEITIVLGRDILKLAKGETLEEKYSARIIKQLTQLVEDANKEIESAYQLKKEHRSETEKKMSWQEQFELAAQRVSICNTIQLKKHSAQALAAGGSARPFYDGDLGNYLRSIAEHPHDGVDAAPENEIKKYEQARALVEQINGTNEDQLRFFFLNGITYAMVYDPSIGEILNVNKKEEKVYTKEKKKVEKIIKKEDFQLLLHFSEQLYYRIYFAMLSSDETKNLSAGEWDSVLRNNMHYAVEKYLNDTGIVADSTSDIGKISNDVFEIIVKRKMTTL